MESMITHELDYRFGMDHSYTSVASTMYKSGRRSRTQRPLLVEPALHPQRQTVQTAGGTEL